MFDHKVVAKEAIELVTPAIMNLFEQTCRKELHIVIMDPRVKPWESDFKDAILYEQTFGTPENWHAPFNEIARLKAKQAWRDSQANIQHQNAHPASLKEGDALYYGSFVYGNVVVGCSGVEQWFDMLVSGWVAVAFEQLAIHKYQQSKKDFPAKAYF